MIHIAASGKRGGGRRRLTTDDRQPMHFILRSAADKGRGFNPDEMPAADALKNIRERAKSIHWKFEVQTAPGEGTRLIVVVQK